MKSFDDFLATISDEEFEKIYFNNAKLFNEDGKIRIADIATYSTMISTSILRRYHDWLTIQLSEQALQTHDD